MRNRSGTTMDLPLAALPLLLLTGLLLNHGTLGDFFLGDDFTSLVIVRDQGVGALWCASPWYYFRPLISFSLWLDHCIWGLNPLGYHLTNVAAHCFNAFMLGSILVLLIRTRLPDLTAPRLTGLAAALIFLALPSRNESVVWIVGRVDTLAAPWFLLSLYLWLRHWENGRLPTLGLALLFHALALLSKEATVALAPLIFLCALTDPRRRPGPGRAFLRTLPFLAVTGLYFLLRQHQLGFFFSSPEVAASLDLGPASLLSRVWTHTIRSLLPHSSSPLVIHLAGGALLALLAYAFWRNLVRRQAGRSLLILLAGAFLLCLGPVLMLHVSVDRSWGERILYLPSLFLVGLLVLTARMTFATQRLPAILALAAILVSAGLKIASDRDWSRAADLSRQAITDLTSDQTPTHMLILSVPGYLGDKMIFNGPAIGAGIRLFDRRPKERQGLVAPLGWLTLRGTAGALKVAHTPGRITVKTTSPDIWFHTSLKLFDQTAYYSLKEFRRDGFRVDLKRPLIDTAVFYYSAGRYHRLPFSD